MTVIVGYRLANWDTPLWVSPNRRESRYGRTNGVVQYWSLHPMAPWAEQLRFHNIRDEDEALQLLQRPWAAQLTIPEDIVEITYGNAHEHGLTPAALVADEWTACQAWSASFDGSGVIVPSAALPGAKNLVMFGPLVRAPYGVAPLDPSVDVPCDPAADISFVPPDLLQFVRWRGDPHREYEAWAAGEPPLPPPVVTVDRRM